MKLLKKLIKDITTEPNNVDYSFILVAAWTVIIYGLALMTLDVIKTGTFEVVEFFDSAGKFIGTIGTVYAIFYGINAFSKNKRKKNDSNS